MSRHPNDWQGQVYHNCEVIKPYDETKLGGHDMWYLKCFCGKIFITQPSEVKRGKTVSCGCYRREASTIRMNKQIENNNGLSIGTKKINYRNYISENNLKIIDPVIPEKDSGMDYWNVLCPKCNQIFQTKPRDVINSKTKSCKCSQYNNMIAAKKARDERIRLENGGIRLTDLNNSLRMGICNPIKQLIFKLDNYTCNLCYGNKNMYFNMHHIVPIKLNSDFKFDKKEDFYSVYDINNLITLCEECHRKDAHNGNGRCELNKEVQKELQLLTSMRYVPKDIQEEYDQIVKNIIEPWIEDYLNNRAKQATFLL
jgi:hypothetical protein